MQGNALLNSNQQRKFRGEIRGLILAVVVGVLTHNIVSLPLLSIPGPLIIAIIVGVTWRALMGIPAHASAGIRFASKKLLQLGIILMGVRLNLNAIFTAGPQIILLDVSVIVLAIGIIYYLGRIYRVEKKLALLTAVGTGICGAAAIAAIAPTIKSDEDETVVSVATVAILGTFGSIIYILLQPYLGLSLKEYGIFAGATLHEVAHVVAASQPFGSAAADMAILTKLGRVAMIVPVTLVTSFWFNLRIKDKEKSGINEITIPWFIFGFIAMSCLNTVGIIDKKLVSLMLQASAIILTVAMAGMGLSVNLKMFKRMGQKAFLIGIIGSVIISIAGFLAIHIIGF
ncbi:membrane protein [Desulforamulus profundi]|uniref:Membrane protein n=1 Tax=Desulforamulus profundi TaxID=1383067 RepID=A0A2C6MC26_9FIRM|nr:putative sulfate exporter family transporter [Desulforamulus profundi]PHJ37112.1 membrane protein [Desulforamulus profundi]